MKALPSYLDSLLHILEVTLNLEMVEKQNNLVRITRVDSGENFKWT